MEAFTFQSLKSGLIRVYICLRGALVLEYRGVAGHYWKQVPHDAPVGSSGTLLHQASTEHKLIDILYAEHLTFERLRGPFS